MTLGSDLPEQTYALGRVLELDGVQIVDLRVSCLNASQLTLHLVPVFQPTAGDTVLERTQGLFHTGGETCTDGLFLLFPTRGAAQDIGLFSARNRHLFDFDVRTHLHPVVPQQLLFKLLHLAARRTHQILATALANGGQIFLAHDASIHHPDPAGLAVFALHHAQNRLHGRDISTIAVEGFVAKREALAVDDQRDYHLLTVRTMVP